MKTKIYVDVPQTWDWSQQPNSLFPSHGTPLGPLSEVSKRFVIEVDLPNPAIENAEKTPATAQEEKE